MAAWKRKLAIYLSAAALTVIAGALLFAWSGIYNVAASRGHWAITEWFLAFAMHNSVENRALLVEAPPPLDDPDLIRLGAGHFHAGCTYCHGAPGIPISPISRRMLPPPPPLWPASQEWDERELFWIVRHGIKYTGMPAWPSEERDDEVWAVVAFLEQLPQLDEASYRHLALGEAAEAPQSGPEMATEADQIEAQIACGRCHGAGDNGPASRLVPTLHGQPTAYLLAALEAYADGLRQSGIMQPIASHLTADARRRVAEYYAGLARPAPPVPASEPAPDSLARGHVIATEGVPAAEIPACLSCHDDGARADFPRLAGQSARYIESQLRLRRRGVNDETPTGAIMGPIARRLNEQQIKDIAAYLASTTTAEGRP